MTVAELIEELKSLPQDAKVVAAFSVSSSDAYLEEVNGAGLRRDLCGDDISCSRLNDVELF